VLADLVETNGFEVHARWAVPLFAELCKKGEVGTESRKVIAAVAAKCLPAVILDAARAGGESGKWANCFAELRPELRAEIFAAAGIQERV
jgi:hypothetical protein